MQSFAAPRSVDVHDAKRNFTRRAPYVHDIVSDDMFVIQPMAWVRCCWAAHVDVHVGDTYAERRKRYVTRWGAVRSRAHPDPMPPKLWTAIRTLNDTTFHGLTPHGKAESASLEASRKWSRETKAKINTTEQRVRRNIPCANPLCRSFLLELLTNQTRSGDEGQTQFMKCKKCGHTFASDS
jgi:DNA-directed RNA polymerase subunit M/transcription elongation factor TFIIS